MCITHDKTTHLVRLTKPKQAYLQSPFAKPIKVRPAHTQISTSGEHVNWLAKSQQQLKQLEPPPIKPQLV